VRYANTLIYMALAWGGLWWWWWWFLSPPPFFVHIGCSHLTGSRRSHYGLAREQQPGLST
jgi:hypothetical protein